MTDLAAEPPSMAAATSTALAEGTYDDALYTRSSGSLR